MDGNDDGRSAQDRGPQPVTHHQLSNRHALFALLLICLFGFSLRVYRLGDQSIWLDEYMGICNLQAPTFLSNLRLLQLIQPEQAASPLYYMLQYYWARIAGMELDRLRWLPLLLGMTSIPLVYLIGSYLCGRTAGLLASLCLALSSQHVWFSQEPRPYALLTPLAALALYGLMRGIREDSRKWWILNAVCNGLLLWTHAFTVLLLLVQGLFLLLFLRRVRFRRAIAWSAFQFLMMLPWMAWMLSMPYHTGFFSNTTFWETVCEIFFDDVVSINTDLLPSWKTNPSGSFPLGGGLLLGLRPALDAALVAFTTLAVSLFTARLLHAGMRWLRAVPLNTRLGEDLENGSLLTLLLVVPGLVLGVLTFSLKAPFQGPMYAIYSTMALYIILGDLVSRCSGRVRRLLGAGLLGLLYLYQAAVFLPDVTRANWRGVANYLEQHAHPEDLVLDLEYIGPVNFLRYYLGGSGPNIQTARTFQAACEDAAMFLNESSDGLSPVPRERCVWLTFEQYMLTRAFPDFDFRACLAEGLSARGLRATEKMFPGHYNASVFRIQRDTTATLRATAPDVDTIQYIDFQALLDELGLEFPNEQDRAAAIAVLRREVAFWPPVYRVMPLAYGFALLEARHPELAEAMAQWFIDRNESVGLAYLLLGGARIQQNDFDAARRAFTRAFDLHPGLQDLVGAFADAVCLERDFDRAKAELKAWEELGFVCFAPGLHASCLVASEGSVQP